MLSHTTLQSLGQVRLEEMHEQARRAALARAAMASPRRWVLTANLQKNG